MLRKTARLIMNRGIFLADEKVLLQRIAGGDKAAFKIIHDHYWPVLYSTATRFLKSPDEAMDVVQEVFFKIWVKRETLTSIDDFKSWLFITTRNKLVSAFRKKQRIHALNQGYLQKETFYNIPEEKLALKQLEQCISEGVAQLSPQQQLIYDLTRNEGLSHDEIAGRLGIAKKTVSNIITRALSGLRRYLLERGDLSTLK
jgi:RNA polymerase sigma-70 factor (family 1)